MTILAGDLGATKTVLALYRQGDRIDQPYRSEKFASGEYTDLDSIVARFLDEAGETPRAAAFGVAGPIIAGKAHITNLNWDIDPERLARSFGIATVVLLNDLQATAIAVPHLAPEDRCTLSAGIPEADGLIAVIAPGTGLGMAFLVPTPSGYRAFPSEGGHMSFAPRGEVEAGLHAFVRDGVGHVSFERICSGSGLPNIYDYLHRSGRCQEPTWLREDLARVADRTPAIVAGEPGGDLLRDARHLRACAGGSARQHLAGAVAPGRRLSWRRHTAAHPEAAAAAGLSRIDLRQGAVSRAAGADPGARHPRCAGGAARHRLACSRAGQLGAAVSAGAPSDRKRNASHPRSARKAGQHSFQSTGQHTHADRRQDQAHYAGDDTHSGLTESCGDGGGEVEEQTAQRGRATTTAEISNLLSTEGCCSPRREPLSSSLVRPRSG